MERVRERRKPRQQRAWLRREVKLMRTLQPLQFHAEHEGEADLKVNTVLIFRELETDIALSLVTRLGTISLLLDPALAQELADGLSRCLKA